jgi:hypothetical protein
MTLQVIEHSVAGWKTYADAADFVPDPMILRAGEVFANGAKGAKALAVSDLEVMAALRDNIGGLLEFFDLVVAYERMPLIDYEYTFDKDSVPMPIGMLLGDKALPVTIGYQAYESVKIGALKSLAAMDLGRIAQFGHQLAELDALRYQWQPSLDGGKPEGWLTQAALLDAPTRLAAQFLLGGLIFSGFAQASLTDHIVQPKRSRFYLALTAAPATTGGATHEEEEAVFTAAEQGLHGTGASVRRLSALPPVLPYLLSKAPDTVTAADLLKRALEFTNTKEGDSYRKAAALIRGDGVQGAQTADLAKAVKAQAQAMLTPFSKLADRAGGLKVEVSVGLEGPKLSASKSLSAPAWLTLWWNENTPFGGLRKTFRRMWLAAESYEALEKRLVAAWARG